MSSSLESVLATQAWKTATTQRKTTCLRRQGLEINHPPRSEGIFWGPFLTRGVVRLM